jgi:hypothetical protein
MVLLGWSQWNREVQLAGGWSHQGGWDLIGQFSAARALGFVTGSLLHAGTRSSV